MKKAFLSIISAICVCAMLAGCCAGAGNLVNKPDATTAATTQAETKGDKETKETETTTKADETTTTKAAETTTTKVTETTAETTPAHVHNWVYTGKTESTCTKNGLAEYKCDCGELSYETLEKKAHDWVFWYTEPVTCEGKGYDVYKCSECQTQDMRNIKDAKGHDLGMAYHIDSTCSYQGYEIYQCKNCTYQEKTYLPEVPHSWYLGMYVDATCEMPGGSLYRCNNCPMEYIDYNREPALGHAMDDVQPDYEEGLEAFYHCPVCVRCGWANTANKSYHYNKPCEVCGY